MGHSVLDYAGWVGMAVPVAWLLAAVVLAPIAAGRGDRRRDAEEDARERDAHAENLELLRRLLATTEQIYPRRAVVRRARLRWLRRRLGQRR